MALGSSKSGAVSPTAIALGWKEAAKCSDVEFIWSTVSASIEESISFFLAMSCEAREVRRGEGDMVATQGVGGVMVVLKVFWDFLLG